MFLGTESEKYLLLQRLIYLWVTYVVLVLLMRYHIPHPFIHHLANVLLAIGAIVQLIAVIYVSVTMSF